MPLVSLTDWVSKGMEFLFAVMCAASSNSCTSMPVSAEAHGVGKDEVIIRTSGDETDAALGEGVRQNGCVFNDLRLICLELITHGFLEADCLTGNDMHERSALRSRENGAVYLLFKLVLAEDYGTSRASEGLMGGAGDDIGIRYGARVHARCDKAADVRHVDHEVCADLIGYLTHLGKVNEA